MNTWIRACSVTLREVLRESLEADPDLDTFFAPVEGGTRVVTLDTPQECPNWRAKAPPCGSTASRGTARP